MAKHKNKAPRRGTKQQRRASAIANSMTPRSAFATQREMYTAEDLQEEFAGRYDMAENLAREADEDPTPNRYFALLGYYEEFAEWLNANSAIKQQANHILGIKKLNDELLKRIKDRLRYFEETYGKKQPSEVELGVGTVADMEEWNGWRRLWERMQQQKGERHGNVSEMLGQDGLRLRHGKNKEGEDIVWTEQINEELPEPPPLAPHTARRSHWQEVVDLQDEMIRFWYTPFGREYGRMWGEHMVASADPDYVRSQQKPGGKPWDPDDTYGWSRHLDAINRACLQQASPIYVSEEVQDTIEYAAKHETFAMEGLTRGDVFPSMHGFCVFPRPFVIKDDYDKNLAFRAISWMPVGPNGELSYDAEYRIHPNNAMGIIIIAYSHKDDPDDYPVVPEGYSFDGSEPFTAKDMPVMSLCYVTPWHFSEYKRPIDMTGSNLMQFCGILQTMWRFAKQTVVVPETTRLPKAFRKRAKRRGLLSDVVVVKLRRKKYATPKDHVPEKMDIDFRYWVGLDEGGFWRNQWYPKEQTHKQIWIAPFLKGPENAPIRYKPLHAFEITQ